MSNKKGGKKGDKRKSIKTAKDKQLGGTRAPPEFKDLF